MKNKFKLIVSLIVSLTLFFGMIPVSVSASQVTQPLVSVYSNHVNEVAAYEVSFYTGNTIDSKLEGSNGDTITIKFPIETSLPASINNSTVKINNVTLNQGSVSINSGLKTVTFIVPNGLSIPQNSYVKLEIASSAGIKNPNTSGTYTLQVSTSKDIDSISSAIYSILDSMITVPQVSVSPNIIGEKGAYFIDFQVSSEGNLTRNVDSIFIFFPLDTVVPTSISNSYIMVNGVPLLNSPTITNNPAITSDPDSRYRMELKVPVDVSVNEEVSIEISPNANIISPTSIGEYNLEIWTTKDLVKNSSVNYQVAAAINETTVWVSPDIAGQIAQYSIAVENGQSALSPGDTITYKFPTGTTLTKTNIADYVYVDGIQLSTIALSSAIVNQAERTITISLQKNISVNSIINVLFTQDAGIQNPVQQSSNYVINVKTSTDTAFRPSEKYTIQGNHIVNLTTQLSNNSVGLPGEYLIQFDVSSTGGLLGGQDRVIIIFPAGTTLPSSISNSAITINDHVITTNPTISISNRTLSFTLPNEASIYRNGNVKINIAKTANIINPNSVGNYSLLVYTSRDPVAIESNDYIVGKSITTPTVTLSPIDYNVAGQYAIGFYTSSQGTLTTSDYVEIAFPSGTKVPSSFSASTVKINGVNASSVSVNSQNVKVYLPAGLNIANNGYVGVVFSTGANIGNPSAGTYQLQVSTSKDQAFVTSQSYTTTGTNPNSNDSSGDGSGTDTSTGNSVSLLLSTDNISDLAEYTISYKTGSNGALRGGIDEISILFSSDVQLPTYISTSTIKVNNVPVNTGWVRIEGKKITFHLPTTVYINDNQTLVIKISELAEINNPNTAGNYGLYVTTTRDSNLVGTTYTIKDQNANGSGDFSVIPQSGANGLVSKYIMYFTTSATGSLRGGYDTITLLLPNSFTSSLLDDIDIKVNGYASDKNRVEISGRYLKFIVPYYVNVGNSQQITITIDDKDSRMLPITSGRYLFLIKTSKDSELIPSNYFDLIAKDSKDEDNKDKDEEDKDNNNNQTSGSKNIKLYIGNNNAQVDGKTESLIQAPTIKNGTTLVPLRFITECLGGTAEYRSEDKRIIIVYEDDYLIFTVGSKNVYTKNDDLTLATPPLIVSGTTLVPLRFISESMGIYTKWNGDERSITLSK